MVCFKFCVILCSFAAVASLPQGRYANDENQPEMPYDFEWTVNAQDFGNDFGHQEESNGNVVQGQYYVLLPDGRRQTVSYSVDETSGYVADVQYEGEARFPDGGSTGGGAGSGYN